MDDALNFDASHQAQEALQSSTRQFRQIVDNIPGLVATRSATGAPEFVNQQMLEFFGQSIEQLPDWSSLLPPDDRERRGRSVRSRSVDTGQFRMTWNIEPDVQTAYIAGSIARGQTPCGMPTDAYRPLVQHAYRY